jgi:hypothetical protein
MSPASLPGPDWAGDRGSAAAVRRAQWRTMVAAFGQYGLPDWRDASAYRFDRLDRPGFAWEWLRRDPAYREAAIAAKAVMPARVGDAGGDAGAAAWGLVAFEDPALAAPVARPMWRADWDMAVLTADAVACDAGHPDAISLDRLQPLASISCTGNLEHLLLTDGWRRVRIDIHNGSSRSGPVHLRWHLAGIDSAAPKIMTLRRFIAVAVSQRFPNRLWPREPRARGWALALRAHAALADGAGQREIATLVAAEGPGQAGWRTRNPSARLQAQRLAGLARSLAGLGFAERYLMDQREHRASGIVGTE